VLNLEILDSRIVAALLDRIAPCRRDYTLLFDQLASHSSFVASADCVVFPHSRGSPSGDHRHV